MPNGSLNKFISDNISTKMEWNTLYNIAVGVPRRGVASTGGSGSVNIRRQLLFVSLPQTAASDAASERRVLRLTPIKPASGKVTQLHLYLSLSISIPRTSEDLESSLHLKLSLHLELPPSQPLSPSRALSISGSLSVTSCIHLRLSGSPSVTICLHLGLSLFSEENPSPISSPSSLTHLRSQLEALLPISDLISKLSLLRAHLISKLSLLLFSLRGLAVTPFLYLHGSIAGEADSDGDEEEGDDDDDDEKDDGGGGGGGGGGRIVYEPTGDRAMEDLRDNITNEYGRGRLPY
ncbi:hypothetical protein YC2023_042729 [Brassica napus]